MKEKRKNSEKVPNVPNLRFPGFDAVWEEKRLDKLAFIERGRFSPRPRNNPIYYGGNIPFVQTSDVVHSRGKIEFYSQTLNDKGLAVSKLFPKGAILITIAANIGYAGILQRDMACPDSLIGIKCKNETYNLFLNILLEINQPKMDYLAVAAAQKNINIEFLKPYKFNLPSLPEQKKIAAFFSSINDRINTQNEIIEKYESLKKGLCQKLFSKNIIFKDDNGNLFSSWERTKLSSVLNEHKLKSTGKEEVHSVSVHKGVINQIEHLGRSFSAKNTDHYNRALPNDIIYTKSPTGEFPLGIIKQNHIKKDVIISPLYGVFTPETKELGYILHVFFESSINTSNYLSSIIQKGAKNTINITNNKFLSKKLWLPVSKQEQIKIASLLGSIAKKIETENHLLEQYKNQKKYFLQNLFI